MSRTIHIAVCSFFLIVFGYAQHAGAANWQLLQGSEPASAGKLRIWGFVQGSYQKDFSDPKASSGAFVPPKLIGPDLRSQDEFNIVRAKVGARGVAPLSEGKINYFLLTELGNNGVTAAIDNRHVTDASITLNYIAGMRVRLGLFKTPGSEEAQQAIHTSSWVNFTTATNQLLLERFPNKSYTANAQSGDGIPPISGRGLVRFDKSVGAFRDVGIQLFDGFQVNGWEYSYALMVGNGNGLDFSDVDDRKDVYAYVSAEKLLSVKGKGAFRPGVKFYAWTVRGKRLLDNSFADLNGDGLDDNYDPGVYDRDRMGVGIKYLKKPYKFEAELIKAEGMIFVGPHKPTFDQNGGTGGGDGTRGKATGWYFSAGFEPGLQWKFNIRYDVLKRLEGDRGHPSGNSMESHWKTVTASAQFYFAKKTHLKVNYTSPKVSTPGFSSGTGPNTNMEGISNRVSVQITHVF